MATRSAISCRPWALHFVLPFVAGVGTAFLLWDHLRVPLHDPLGICSLVTRIGFNPVNNVLRFAMLLTLPLLALMVLRAFDRPGIAPPRPPDLTDLAGRDTPVGPAILAIVLSLSFALNAPTFIAEGEFDVFHEGESLGPAVSYAHGQVPYADFVFIHGFFQDPGRAVTAFHLFGRSIGAVRTLESILKVITWVLLAWFLIRLHGRRVDRALFFLTCMGLLAMAEVLILMPRDLLTIALLLIALYFGRWAEGIPRTHCALLGHAFLLGVIPGAGLAYSFDRGAYYSVAVLLMVPVLLWIAPQRDRLKAAFVCSTSTGFAIGALLLGWVIRWNYAGLHQFCVVEMVRFKDLMDSYVFNIHRPLYAIPAIVAAFCTYAVFHRAISWGSQPFLTRIRAFLRSYFMECVMVLIGLLLLRNALGRADSTHVFYSWPFILMAFLHFILIGFPIAWIPWKAPMISARSLYVVFGVLALSGLTYAAATGGLRANFPLDVPDEAFIPAEDQATVAYLRTTMAPDDAFITLTGEAGWYYYLDQPCPVRFNVIQYALLPSYQAEVVDALATGRVKYILYRNTNWYMDLDHCTNMDRIPRVMSHVHDHFEPHRTIGHNELWIARR